ncbi:MAG: efflux RND transporter permease subunit, partial [Vicinamibacterales bacterium]
DPMLSAYWPDPHVPPGQRWFITRALDRFNAWFDRQADAYKRLIGWALDHRWKMVFLAVAAFAGAIALPATGIVGGEFFPVTDDSEFNVSLDTPPGSNLEYTKVKAEEVARVARSKSEVLYTYTAIGGQTGSVDEGTVYVRLKPKHERERSQNDVAAELRQELSTLGGATASITTSGFGDQKQILVQITGPEARELQRLADQVQGLVRKVPGAVDVDLSTRGQKPELEVQLDRALAGSIGVTAGQVAQALRPAFAGIDVGDWVDPAGETRDVTVRFTPEARSRTSDLSTLPLNVAAPDGQMQQVPLGQLATIRSGIGPARIDHLDRERVITVQANTQNRPLSQVIQDIEAGLAGITLPPGYSIKQGGETEDQREVFGRIIAALAVAILLMYLVLVVQFGSFLDPLAIMISLPLSLIGVMLALLVTGSTLNLMSMIGVILLMGIVAKNAILLIDFAKWAEESGKSRRDALIEAGRVRLRPILMTTFALIAGMIPVAIGAGEGADFRAPLGRAVIGGVITSTILTLLVIPTFYEIMTEWRDWALEKLRFGSAPAHGHGPGHATAEGMTRS